MKRGDVRRVCGTWSGTVEVPWSSHAWRPPPAASALRVQDRLGIAAVLAEVSWFRLSC